MLKYFLGLILFLLGLTVGLMFLPIILGIFIGIIKFEAGKILGGIVAIAIGLLVQGLLFLFVFNGDGIGSGYSEDDDECPFCGSGDTDGNHCFTCDDDF